MLEDQEWGGLCQQRAPSFEHLELGPLYVDLDHVGPPAAQLGVKRRDVDAYVLGPPLPVTDLRAAAEPTPTVERGEVTELSHLGPAAEGDRATVDGGKGLPQ